MLIQYEPIGIIHSPFKNLEGMPIQPGGATGIKGRIDLLPQFETGLKDLDGFSHLIILYHFHRSAEYKLQVTPFLDTVPRGLFATRAPSRPNSIGLSVVKLQEIQRISLLVEDIDILNNTPLLDIKPYIPAFDEHTDFRMGWLENSSKNVKEQQSDQRFVR